MADGDPKTGVMIAFLPTTDDWCKIELPHMTLVYAGKTTQLNPGAFNELAKDASSIAAIMRPFALRVAEQEIFGPDDERVKVFRLTPTAELWAARRFVERWNKSEHPFNPHCTIGPESVYVDIVPRVLGFNKLMVAFGEDQITFNLNGGY